MTPSIRRTAPHSSSAHHSWEWSNLHQRLILSTLAIMINGQRRWKSTIAATSHPSFQQPVVVYFQPPSRHHLHLFITAIRINWLLQQHAVKFQNQKITPMQLQQSHHQNGVAKAVPANRLNQALITTNIALLNNWLKITFQHHLAKRCSQ